jgi:subtilisin family serine protease
VASVNSEKAPSIFNTRNDNVSLFAPGENIAVSNPNTGAIQRVSGTSFACPFAAAMAALILSTMRAEDPTRPNFRVPKATMVQILRNSDHLGLSCAVHNYTRPNGCSVAGLSDATVPTLKNSMFRMALQELSTASTTTLVLVFVGLICLIFASIWFLNSQKIGEQVQSLLN